MATTTSKYSFTLPAQTDNYDIDVQNNNWSTADATLKSISDAAAAAQTTANAAIPQTQRGQAGGVAPLGADTKLPVAYLPTASSGSLGAIKIGTGFTFTGDGTLTASPGSIGAVAANLIGAANGLATLGADGKVPTGQLPPLNYVPTSEKGQANGTATLGSDSKLTAAQMPIASVGTLGGVKQGSNITIAADGSISGAAPYSLPSATTAAIGGMLAAALPPAGNPVSPIRTASACDLQITSTAATQVLTYTPTAKGNFVVYANLNVTAATAVQIEVKYTDARGNAASEMILPSQNMSAGVWTFDPRYITAAAGQPITVIITAGTANQVYASATIMGV
jgi:hypothetical protein